MELTRDHFIVAIGASAGGLEAIHEFFDHMSDGTNVSFVIIQHLSSDYKSLLVELVSRHTNMKVFEAENNMKISKNCIYVIPNNKLITIGNNKLCLEEKKNAQVPNNAIDIFLHSLALERKEKAIAVILSGTGSDGTKGTEAIKNNGGMVIVQDPDTAKFNGMPNSAIQSGIADHILAPEDMPEKIVEFINEPLIQKLQEFKESDLEEIFRLIHETAGFDFHYYKLPTITRRITRRMMQLGYRDLYDYISLLKKDVNECRQLGNDFLIGVTSFFRDTEAFKLLEEKALQELVNAKQPQEIIKIWVCACSTGEEAYSIAILLNELIEKSDKNIDVKIFATDVDQLSLDIAAKGIYPETINKFIDEDLLEKYFTKRGSEYQITQKVRKQIVFAKHDVIKDPPFINNDLVSCRNMLIYISQHLQQKIFSLLLFALNKNGFLFLGSSEHSTYIRDNVEEISSKWKIYRKVKESKITSHYMTSIAERRIAGREFTKPQPVVSGKPKPIWEALKQTLTEDLNFAAFFIDQGFIIKESAGNYDRFLTLPKKSLHLNLLQMVPSELYFILSTEIKKVWKEEKTVVLKNLRSKKDNKIISWQVTIKPQNPYTLVTILEQDVVENPIADHASSEDNYSPKDNYIITLESELEETKNNLNLAVEDLETTNEELQSSNEELLSANEELQSSNEELQSLNEELHTLNTEHQLKIKELVELNDDLNNYFRSTDIAQIFLDKKMRIRKFNPASANMINFIDSDIGRPISHISNNIQYDNFNNDVELVLRKKEIIEKEVLLANGKNLLMRIMPYLSREREINGVIISFVDITTMTQLNNIIKAVLNSSPGSIFAFKAVRQGRMIKDFILQTVNNAAESFLAKHDADITGSSLLNDIPQLAHQNLFEQFVRVVEDDILLHKDVFFDDEQKWYSLIAAKMMDGFVVTLSDITSKKRSEQKLKRSYLELISVKDNLKKTNEQLENKVVERTRELAQSEERFRLVAQATNDALWDWDLVNNKVWWSDTFFKMFGHEKKAEYSSADFWLEKIHPGDVKEVQQTIYEAINSGNKQWNKDYRLLKSNGQYAHILDRGYILHDEFGTPYRMLGSMFDVTELKEAESKLATMNEQLEHKVAERTQELEEINTALEASNNDLQQFASVASHDLQEPLRKIQLFAKILQESHEDRSDSATYNYIEKIIRASERMRSLITNILNYSRLSADDNSYELTNLNELLNGILEDFELTIKEKKAIIHIDPLPSAEINPGQLRQVFQNLVSNSLKFNKPNAQPEITIAGYRLAKRSFMSMRDDNGPYCLITMTDNGIGFDPEFTNNIFNLFQRLHSKDKYEGTGIGLAITKKIIEKHNGLIRADSKENEGATFSIILPVYQQR
jgi:two-component system, chemotaxis family, CheB/CheR fusion protein